MDGTMDSIKPSEGRNELSYMYARDPSILTYAQRPIPSVKKNLISLYEEEESVYPADETCWTISNPENLQTVKVYLRLKPLPRKIKLTKEEAEAYQIVNSTTLLTKLPSLDHTISSFPGAKMADTVFRKFTFSHTFGPEITQFQLFEEIIQQKMVDFLAGRKATVMTYGESEATAAQYLALADGNVESAISLMFESGGPGEQEAGAASNNDEEAPVREPILPTQEVLVPSEPVCSFPRASNNVFDRFRDFAVETRRQEEEMTRRVNGVRKASQARTKRLEDLFRPPCDILFLGSFIEARERAKDVNRWLLVNVQNSQEFACQILNRDVWPNSQIREIIKDHFVLWQVLSNTSDGKRYIDFYNVAEYPYLAIIDPRTGECMRSYNHITVDSLAMGLNDMLSTHASPDNTPQDPANTGDFKERSSLPNKRQARTDSVMEDSGARNKKLRASASSSETAVSATVSSSTSNSIVGKRSRIDELEAKSRASPVSESTESLEKEPSVVEAVKKTSASKEALKKELHESATPIATDEPSLRLCLRLPSGGKEAFSMCANDTVEAFIKRMEDMGYASSEHTYLVPFPKTNVGALPSHTRLSDTILYPSNTVFITKV